MDEEAPYPILLESTFANDEWTHDKCGTVIMEARVHHSIHDGPIPLSGSGRVHVETVPYCPKCETKPSPYGAPITPS